MFTFRFDGEKIASIKEFMDSKYVTHVLEVEAKAKEKKEAWSVATHYKILYDMFPNPNWFEYCD